LEEAMSDDILRQAAAAMGKKGGKSRSAAKVAASRENGRKNIKPKTEAAPVSKPAPAAPLFFVSGNGEK
jgi:hypothetical protein